MKLTMFAIRHIPTGGYLPAPKGRGGRGGSHMEPVVFDENSNELPRLFGRRASAQAAIIHWAKGIYKVDRTQSNVVYLGIGVEEPEETIYIDPQPHRRREDMEVVAIEVVLP